MKTYDIINAGSNNRFMANRRIVSNSGRIVQLQNLFRNSLPDLMIARDLVKQGNYDALASLYESVPEVLAQCVRTAFIPAPGMKFIVADFSAIEARVIAWLANETWRMRSFAAGEDIYCASASQMFGVPVEKHGINGHLRQKGKVAELACIAEGQLALTDRGEVPIEEVRIEDKVWDGEEWVCHEGVVYRGEREVITYDGLTATPDHLVWIEGKTEPIQFGIAAASGAHLIQTGDGGRAIQLSGSNPETVSGPYQGRDYSGCRDSGIRTEEELAYHQRTARLYDIRNAGRHHRFTVSGRLVHNCGYGGGVGALKAFGAIEMGLTEEELQTIVSDWRSANPNIVKLWWAVDRAVKTAIKEHKTTKTHSLEFKFQGGMLYITLPSGRQLCYVQPRIGENKFGGESVNYMGTDMTKHWSRIESYGPKFVENIVQGISRDILCHAMDCLRDYRIVAHVHDECIVECPPETTVEEICSLMATVPPWAEGLILRADGYECMAYQKD